MYNKYENISKSISQNQSYMNQGRIVIYESYARPCAFVSQTECFYTKMSLNLPPNSAFLPQIVWICPRIKRFMPQILE